MGARRLPRLHRLVLGACAAFVVLHELRLLLAPEAGLGPLTSRFAHDVVLVAAAAMCLARAAGQRGGERLAWGLIGAGVLAWTLGEIYYTAVLWNDSDPPIPSLADAGYLLFPVLLLAGGMVLLRTRARGVPRRLWVDGVTAALSVSALSAAIVFETVLESVEGRPLAVAASLAYPLTDLVLLGLFVGALASTGWRFDRTWMLLALGVTTFWLADSLYLVQTSQGVYESGGWFDAGWWLGLTLIAAAAWQHAPAVARDHMPAEERLRVIAVPLGFGAVGLGLLVYGAIVHLNPLAIGLAAASLVAVMARATLTFAENVTMLQLSRGEALTDPLTGLGNRRALQRALDELIPAAHEDRPLVLAIFDLDGFKAYNDAFGHPAGDTLLIRLGANLEAFLHGRGHAFRMGGDEFCALFEAPAGLREAIVLGAAEALSDHGDGFAIDCSHGAVTLPAECDRAPEALRIADQRMYANKHAGRLAAARRGGIVGETVALAAAAASTLGLDPDAVEDVRHAAELHDVGKVALPDAILGKPGPLTESEWEFVHRHPVIGERMILATPALRRAAALVRASHERWDGTGYPDALAGTAVPLGARIVAVADAYAAMTAERPWRPALTPEAAIAELRRGAGSQFDPAVVDAWCAAWALRTLAAAA